MALGTPGLCVWLMGACPARVVPIARELAPQLRGRGFEVGVLLGERRSPGPRTSGRRSGELNAEELQRLTAAAIDLVERGTIAVVAAGLAGPSRRDLTRSELCRILEVLVDPPVNARLPGLTEERIPRIPISGSPVASASDGSGAVPGTATVVIRTERRVARRSAEDLARRLAEEGWLPEVEPRAAWETWCGASG